MEESKIYLIFDKKDRKWVEKNIGGKPESDPRYHTDDVHGAQSVLYFESTASKKNPRCMSDLQYAQDNGLPIETVNLGGSAGSVIAGIIVLLFLAGFAYVLGGKVVPNVVGAEVSQAVAILKGGKFTPKLQYEYSDAYPAGYAAAQNITCKYVPYLPVTVTVSLGEKRDLTAVPDLTGLELSEALASIAEAGFRRCRVTVGGEGGSGVTGQNIPAGYMVSDDSRIGLTVSGGSTVTAELMGRTLSLPGDEGAYLDVDLLKGSSRITEAYVKKTYEDAEYLYATTEKFLNEPDFMEIDKPVVVSGDDLAIAYFPNITFNNDLLIQTERNRVSALLCGDCQFNGMVYVENSITETDADTFLPALFISKDIKIELLHGSVTLIVEGHLSVEFNGKTYRFEDAKGNKDLSAIVALSQGMTYYSPEDPNVHVITCRMEDGEQITEHQLAHFDVYSW